MTGRVAALFPGLGAYSTGMLRSAAAEYPVVAETFAEIDEAAAQYGMPSVGQVVLRGDPLPIGEVLKLRAEIAQLAIFGCSVAVYRVLTGLGMRPYVLIGHSFGEIAALVSAGAFTLADGVRLVCARAEALVPWEGKGAMAAIGANVAVTRHLIGALDEPELVVACVNAPQQTVISGPLDPIARAERTAAALDLFFARLQLPYASHHPAARPAMTAFLGLIEDVPRHPLAQTVYSPVHGRRYTDTDDVRQSVAEGVVRPVLFADAVRELHTEGVTTFVECGALNALTRCVELTVPNVEVIAPLLNPADEIAGLRRAVGDEPAPVSVPMARTPPEQPDRDAVLARLRRLYAAALEYPEEVLTEDAMLEAQLGVDSLKQTALLRKVITEFGLSEDAATIAVWELPSLGRIADHVLHTPAGTPR